MKLQVEGLTKLYRNTPVVNDVAFSIEGGKVVGYLGPNGSGKSTTVKMLTGLVEPTRGSILFDGIDVRKHPIEFKHRLGYVPEEAHFYSALTGMEYLELIGHRQSICARNRVLQRRNWAHFIAQNSGLNNFSKPLREHSGYSSGAFRNHAASRNQF